MPASFRPAVLFVVAACVLGACSNDSAEEAEPTTGSQRSDESVIAFAVTGLGQEDLVVDAELAERHVFVLYQVAGDLDVATARCATDLFVESYSGGEVLGDVPISELLSEETQKARRDAARACEPVPTGPTTSVDPFVDAPPDTLPADLDPVMLRDHLVEMTEAAARTQGLTETEAECFAEASYGGLDDRQIIAVQRPEAYPDVELAERDGTDEVRDCLEEDRISTLAEQLRDSVAALQEQQQED